MSGDDVIYGGDGNDYMYGGGGYDIMFGGAGDDTYWFADGIGEAYEDADGGNDTVWIDIGDWTLGEHFENLAGWSGTNVLAGNASSNYIAGASGDDVISGMEGDDFLYGDSWNFGFGDSGIDGNDWIDGGRGSDTIHGEGGDDQLFGGAGFDMLDGGDDNDTLTGGGMKDTMLGGAGNDSLFGNNGHDEMFGGDGRDFLKGGVGNDLMDGGADNDDLRGGSGKDTLFGGAGQDMLRGDDGADTFAWLEGDFAGMDGAGADRILDFDRGDGDQIDLSAIDAIFGDEDDAFTFVGSDDFSGTAGELRYEFAEGYTMVYMHVDGDAAADFAIRLDGTLNLLASDFVL